ncbi:hypothetical protein BURKHO8Y_240012 [Burkholderia sp. 8Y]|nr:hypothetical protein BURKHO8Y_240012 [Burkholderia sp. 8Y]
MFFVELVFVSVYCVAPARGGGSFQYAAFFVKLLLVSVY